MAHVAVVQPVAFEVERLDVAAAIGDEIGVEVPARIRDLIAAGALGRKAGRGFYDYPERGRTDPKELGPANR